MKIHKPNINIKRPDIMLPKRSEMLTFDELPREVKNFVINDAVKNVIFAIILLALGFVNLSFFFSAVLATVILVIFPFWRYFSIIKGDMIILDGVVLQIDNCVDVAVFSSFESNKVLVIETVNALLRITVPKKTAKKATIGMAVRVVVNEKNMSMDKEGFVAIHNPVIVTYSVDISDFDPVGDEIANVVDTQELSDDGE